MTCSTLYERYYSILAATLERQHDGRDRSSTTDMVRNRFDNHIQLDYTVVVSIYIPPSMALVYCKT
jgi:hypothetical protein